MGYRLTLEYDTEPGGTSDPLVWGVPEVDVLRGLNDVGADRIGLDAGTAFVPGAPRDVTIYIEDDVPRETIDEILSRFPHGSRWMAEPWDYQEGEGGQ